MIIVDNVVVRLLLHFCHIALTTVSCLSGYTLGRVCQDMGVYGIQGTCKSGITIQYLYSEIWAFGILFVCLRLILADSFLSQKIYIFFCY